MVIPGPVKLPLALITLFPRLRSVLLKKTGLGNLYKQMLKDIQKTQAQ